MFTSFCLIHLFIPLFQFNLSEMFPSPAVVGSLDVLLRIMAECHHSLSIYILFLGSFLHCIVPRFSVAYEAHCSVYVLVFSITHSLSGSSVTPAANPRAMVCTPLNPHIYPCVCASSLHFWGYSQQGWGGCLVPTLSRALTLSLVHTLWERSLSLPHLHIKSSSSLMCVHTVALFTPRGPSKLMLLWGSLPPSGADLGACL